jgi:hypothetical protein
MGMIAAQRTESVLRDDTAPMIGPVLHEQRTGSDIRHSQKGVRVELLTSRLSRDMSEAEQLELCAPDICPVSG